MRIPWPRQKPPSISDEADGEPHVETERTTGGQKAREEAEKALREARAKRSEVDEVATLLRENRDLFTDAIAASMRRRS